MQLTYTEYKIKSAKGTPQVYFDYFYRAVSHPVSYIFLRLGVSPNQISYTSILLAIVAGMLICFSHPLLGMVVFMVSYLLDFCDGNVARVIMASGGMSQAQKNNGSLLENLNTNIALLSFYASVGYIISVSNSDILYLLFAFLVFGLKMVTRYGAAQVSSLYRDQLKQLAPGKEFMEEYKNSLKVKFRFFLRKSFFSANFYYVVYFVSFLLFTEKVGWFFVFYAFLDAAMNGSRLVLLLARKYS
jgi:hypothetical protein